MSIRISAGKYKGAVLESPPSARPTLSRSRQALFDILESLSPNRRLGQFFKEKKIIDCFAGSGALGIEALSRGASFAFFIDIDKKAIDTIYKNVKSLNLELQCRIMKGDAYKLKSSNKYRSEICDIAFLDPPYGKVSIIQTIEHLKSLGWLDFNSLLITEEDKHHTENFSHYNCIRKKEMGDSVFTILTMM
ncbi:MAG: 16S rRNA (guanine(966)-N(2))-methyltransferase RsmD [Alphaproteobacteria bacterium]|nr:16S rRNA (guanine(966)-N(2))-methyltransferase RsmD [Alphaproteobacteria bacterium]